MIRIINNNWLPVLSALLLFASCGKEEYGPEESTGGENGRIRFEIAVGTAAATASGVQTRVATSTDGNYTNTFNSGDEIGIYIVKGSGGLQSSDNWVNNMKLTYNNGTWDYTLLSGKEYYPIDGDLLHFYAYYPYNSSVTNALNMNVSVLPDQSSTANLSKSNLLHASRLNVGKGSTPVQLVFSHLFTLVELSAISGGAGAQMSSEVTVTLEGCKPDVSFDLSTGATIASGNAASVKMYRVEQSGDADYLTEYTYRALVPAQQINPGTNLFRFSQTQGTVTRTLSHTLASAVVLNRGEVKPYDITLQGASDTHTYAVGDYYPNKGFPILGIVFDVSNGGSNGKIVDLSFIQRYAPVPGSPTAPITWGPNVDEDAAGVTGIRDYTNGYAGTRNLIIKRKDQSDFGSYGIFNWIYQTKNNENVDGIWYLPAYGEYKQLVAIKENINPKITEAGGSSCIGRNYVRVLTEHNATKSGIVDGAGNQGEKSKSETTYSLYAVAIGKF